MKKLCADLAKIKEIVDGMYDHDLRSRLQAVVAEANVQKLRMEKLQAAVHQIRDATKIASMLSYEQAYDAAYAGLTKIETILDTVFQM